MTETNTIDATAALYPGVSGFSDTIMLPDTVLTTIDSITQIEEQLEISPSDGYDLESEISEQRFNERLLLMLKDHDVWEFDKIEITVGSTEITLDYEALGISAATLSVLQGGNRKFKKVRMIMFEALESARGKLQHARKKLQHNHLVYTGHSWVCLEEKLPIVAIELQGLYSLCDELKAEVLTLYVPELRRFLEAVAALLVSVSDALTSLGEDPLDISSLLYEYKEKFPSPQAVQSKFQVTVQGPHKIESLANQAQDSADMKAALAKMEQAGLDREQVQATQQMFELQDRQKREAIMRGAEYAETRILQATQRVLDRIQGSRNEPGYLTKSRKKIIEEALQELQELRGLLGAESMVDLFGESEALVGAVNSVQSTRQQIDERVKAMLDTISRKVEFQTAGDRGHRSAGMAYRPKLD